MGLLNYVQRFLTATPTAVPKPLETPVYLRNVQDLQQRLSLQTLTREMVVAASAHMSQGNPSEMARINDAMLQTDPEIKAALKQLKTAVCAVEFAVTPPNDSVRAATIADDIRTALADPDLNVRAMKGWIVEHRVRGGGLIEAVWNDPTETPREWERFVVVPQQRVRFNMVSGELQYAETPYVYQGTDVSQYDAGKWIVVQPDLHVQDFALRGICPAMLNDWFGRLNVMGWWNQAIERDAMKTLVAKAGSQADADALDVALRNRGAAGAFLIRDPNSSITQLEGTAPGRGVSPYGEYMTHTASRMFLALLGETQTGLANTGSLKSSEIQYEVARYVVEDICTDIADIIERDLFTPYVMLNYGPGDEENVPGWVPKLDEPVDIVALNEALSTRPMNVDLGVNWYRKATGWPAPLPNEEPLDRPMPLPGQAPLGQSPKIGRPNEPNQPVR
jgi:hypothetical protein